MSEPSAMRRKSLKKTLDTCEGNGVASRLVAGEGD